MKTILKTLVGSRAHGLNDSNSDYDYRAVFMESTSSILSLEGNKRTTNWIEGEIDNTSYELHHFLKLACNSNPSVLEVFVSPLIDAEPIGYRIRENFKHVWSSKGVYKAFLGYSNNQQKKFLENKDCKSFKFAIAYIRILLLGTELLEKGTMTVEVDRFNKERLLKIKRGELTMGAIIDIAKEEEEKLLYAYSKNDNKLTNYDEINNLLLDIRKNNW
jgi:predicted nucleotidyltransferase